MLEIDELVVVEGLPCWLILSGMGRCMAIVNIAVADFVYAAGIANLCLLRLKVR